MIKSGLLIGAAGLALTACSEAENTPSQTQESQKLSATHAFETPDPVSALAFSPNDVASWLGTLAMITDSGQLLITNIEGKKAKPQSGGPYKDVIGANRKGQPALFFALTESGELRAFIEADDNGNFKALPISSESQNPTILCKPASGFTDALIVITADGEIVTLATEIDASAVLRKSKTLGKAKDANACVVSEGQVLTLSGNTLSNTGGKRITVDAAANGLAIFKSGAETYLAIARPESPVLSLYAADTLSPAGSFDIVSGLSISGLDAGASGVWATSAAFGGSGFNSGVIALSDSAESRLVIMSNSYIANELAKTNAR